jgi:hypothetical protein
VVGPVLRRLVSPSGSCRVVDEMKMCGENGDFLEIERAASDVDGYDIWLRVCVQFRGFSAEIDTWVLRAAWLGFAQHLGVLEERRQGEAKLEGMSPDELSITIRSTDRAGHMGVEGTVGARSHNYIASLQIAVLVFDPSQLPALVHDARLIGGHVP